MQYTSSQTTCILIPSTSCSHKWPVSKALNKTFYALLVLLMLAVCSSTVNITYFHLTTVVVLGNYGNI
jgi:hypothetical protein